MRQQLQSVIKKSDYSHSQLYDKLYDISESLDLFMSDIPRLYSDIQP